MYRDTEDGCWAQVKHKDIPKDFKWNFCLCLSVHSGPYRGGVLAPYIRQMVKILIGKQMPHICMHTYRWNHRQENVNYDEEEAIGHHIKTPSQSDFNFYWKSKVPGSWQNFRRIFKIIFLDEICPKIRVTVKNEEWHFLGGFHSIHLTPWVSNVEWT